MITFRLYLVPKVGLGTRVDPFRPKYTDSHLLSLTWGGMDFGLEPVYLIGVQNIPDEVDAAMRVESDVVALPINLDQTIGTELATTRNVLETLNIPGNWIQSSDIYRLVVRTVAGLFQFAQRLNGVTTERLFSGRTLATRFNQLPPTLRTSMIEAATSLNYDISTLSGTTTLRVILKTLADQWGNRPFIFSGFSI